MKHILLINVSPRRKGTSAVLAALCKAFLDEKGHAAELLHLYADLEKPDEIYAAVNRVDTIVLSGPCYINTYPADTIALLSGLAAHGEVLHDQDLYGMIQGGMPYAHTHECGLKMLELFGSQCNVTYKGGFVMGLGAMLNGQPLNKLPNGKKVLRQLYIFFEHIGRGEYSPRQVYLAAQPNLPVPLTALMAWMANRTIDRDLKSRGIDADQPSPYLTAPGQVQLDI